MKKTFFTVIVAVLLPVFFKALFSARLKKFCPFGLCLGAVVRCTMESRCRTMLECFSECEYPFSEGRNASRAKYYYVQHPDSPALCQYGCMELASTPAAQELLECVGGSGCMEASEYSDECAPLLGVSPDDGGRRVLPFSAVPDEVWEGRWIKLFTNSWDVWPCQSTEFFPPGGGRRRDDSPPPREWMTSWPRSPGVWRMDLNWTTTVARAEKGDEQQEESTRTTTFSMSSEMYPEARWRYAGGTEADPTLKTIACMWGTEAHENWYLLHYDRKYSWILLHVCAYTSALQSFDALSMVFVKEGGTMNEDIEASIQAKALQLLGEKFGTLQRVSPCISSV
uniref:VDE lipocalin domain-containing protein n=1 Tax=Odontella aurita TaxID=265563 RepID=A0A7S4K930_9STRA|mmetsp:Transcript_6907/g.20726  ORF Transcript_6907/g.20726 Transcript_6907/m.20726 type:complete len:339 (+) Transcript_6907:150-1166(+)